MAAALQKFSTDKIANKRAAERFRTVEDQLHVLPHAEREVAVRVSSRDAGGFFVHVHVEERRGRSPMTQLQHCQELLHSFFMRLPLPSGEARDAALSAPPPSRRMRSVLRAFTELIPDGTRAAFEFRHASWFDGDIYEILRSRNLALCVAKQREDERPGRVDGELRIRFRLRDEGYQQSDLERWADVVGGLHESDRRVNLLQARGAGPGSGIRAAFRRGGFPRRFRAI